MPRPAKGMYRNRKEQLDRMGAMLIKALREHGLNYAAVPEDLIADSLKTAAMIGAAAERQRTLEMIHGSKLIALQPLSTQICAKSVFAVLGYPEANAEMAAPVRRKGNR